MDWGKTLGWCGGCMVAVGSCGCAVWCLIFFLIALVFGVSLMR